MNIFMALVLGLLILLCELMRVKKFLYLDFMRAVSIVFFLIYVFVPLVFNTIGPSTNPRFFWFNMVRWDDVYLSTMTIAMAIIGYLGIFLGFKFGNSSSLVRESSRRFARVISNMGVHSWVVLALISGLFSVIAATAYVMRRGGSVSLMLQYSGQIRVNQLPSGVEETSFTFLTYAMLGITSALILVGLRQKSLFLSVLALLFIGESGLVLWMRAGRLHLINFVLVLCLIYFSKKPRWFQLVGVFMALGALWLIFYYGKYLTRVTFVLDTPNDLMGHLQLVASEMAFPYLSLANVIENGATWRLFMDIPLGLLYVFVNPAVRVFSGSPFDLVPSVAKVNTESLIGTAFWGEIPVDIVTFGYYNGGPIGVVVTCFLWGVLISWFERALPEGVTGVTSALRFAFIVFLSTVGTVYSDPVNVLRDGLYLVVPFLTLFGLMWLQPQRARGKVVRVSSV